jgi:hypothetical protein
MSRPLFASCFFFAAPGVTVHRRGDLGQGLQRMALVSKVLGSATGRYWLDMEFKQWNGDDCKRIPNYLILMGWVWI